MVAHASPHHGNSSHSPIFLPTISSHTPSLFLSISLFKNSQIPLSSKLSQLSLLPSLLSARGAPPAAPPLPVTAPNPTPCRASLRWLQPPSSPAATNLSQAKSSSPRQRTSSSR